METSIMESSSDIKKKIEVEISAIIMNVLSLIATYEKRYDEAANSFVIYQKELLPKFYARIVTSKTCEDTKQILRETANWAKEILLKLYSFCVLNQRIQRILESLEYVTSSQELLDLCCRINKEFYFFFLLHKNDSSSNIITSLGDALSQMIIEKPVVVEMFKMEKIYSHAMEVSAFSNDEKMKDAIKEYISNIKQASNNLLQCNEIQNIRRSFYKFLIKRAVSVSECAKRFG